jgi:type I restriction enzyme S subunit
MARALFQSWFVDFDPVRAKLDGRPPEGMDADTAALFPEQLVDSPHGHIPQGWKFGKIQDCCVQIQNGGTPRRNEPRFWDGGNIPWLASGEVRQSIITSTDSFITEEGLAGSSAKWVPAFSTVVALYGATAGQVSFTSSRLTTNQAVCALIPKKDFAFFNYLTMREATAELENKAVGSAQQNISKGIVEETKVVLPPPVLVERFSAAASPLFERWISNLHQSRTLATLRDTLLPKLLSGEVSASADSVIRESRITAADGPSQSGASRTRKETAS